VVERGRANTAVVDFLRRARTDPPRRSYIAREVSFTTTDHSVTPLRQPPETRERVGAWDGRAADRRLAARLVGDDARALEEIHARSGAAVFSYLRRLLRDVGSAEDVFQQVFAEVWRRRLEYDPARSALTTWLFTIARSRALDEQRRRHPWPVDPAALPEAVAPPAHDAEIDRWLVADLLGSLPALERELLQLRFYDELSQTEIAARTGLPLGTVKTRMVRALARLRERMDEEGLR
jgi:RNA polymerase sigma-70 factor, ECF subfamily